MDSRWINDLFTRSILLIPVAIGFGYAFILSKLPTEKEAGDGKEVKRGILLVLMGHIIVFGLFALSSRGNEFIRSITEAVKAYSAFIFLAQLAYVIPLLIAAAAKGRGGIIKGALIASSLTFLLSIVSCFGLGALR